MSNTISAVSKNEEGKMEELDSLIVPLDLATLIILNEKGTQGARNPEVTQKILKTRENGANVSEPDVRFSAFGLVSDRISNIISMYQGLGYVEQYSPAKITDEGREFLQNWLKNYDSNPEMKKNIERFVVETKTIK